MGGAHHMSNESGKRREEQVSDKCWWYGQDRMFRTHILVFLNVCRIGKIRRCGRKIIAHLRSIRLLAFCNLQFRYMFNFAIVYIAIMAE
jgi:hypothetical protein